MKRPANVMKNAELPGVGEDRLHDGQPDSRLEDRQPEHRIEGTREHHLHQAQGERDAGDDQRGPHPTPNLPRVKFGPRRRIQERDRLADEQKGGDPDAGRHPVDKGRDEGHDQDEREGKISRPPDPRSPSRRGSSEGNEGDQADRDLVKLLDRAAEVVRNRVVEEHDHREHQHRLCRPPDVRDGEDHGAGHRHQEIERGGQFEGPDDHRDDDHRERQEHEAHDEPGFGGLSPSARRRDGQRSSAPWIRREAARPFLDIVGVAEVSPVDHAGHPDDAHEHVAPSRDTDLSP